MLTIPGQARGPLPLDDSAWAASYLGDFSQDGPSVLLALSQSLHGSQEFLPVLDFLHHCIEGEGPSEHKAVGVHRGPESEGE